MTDLTPTDAGTTKPFYKRWWFIALAAVFVLGVIGSNADDHDPSSAILATDSPTTSTAPEEPTTTSTAPTTTTEGTTTTTTEAATTTTEFTLSDADKRAI
ncbi:MAG TPA: hypothetical protein VLB67_01310, partial [Acidimicrobiia bacterium]|nr:hypothetical protein [Acidimicrobiia bacterium]